MRVAVIGGGISGLAAAQRLTTRGVEVAVFESAARLGGKILTTEFAGRPVEEGPDAFLLRTPAAVDLCRGVGLGDELVSPATGQAYVWTGGALAAIPEGTVLGVPASLGAIRRATMLSPAGKARAAIEPLLPRSRFNGDIAVGRLVRRRFGREVHERLVDPLIGGINAGRTDSVSLDAGAAQLAPVARQSRSLFLGLRRQRRAASAAATGRQPAPVFATVRGGLTRLVTALGDSITRAGGDIRTGTAVASIARAGDQWRLTSTTGELGDFDGVVVAVPAFAANVLLARASARAARLLAGIEHASVALVTVSLPRGAIEPPAGSGFLVPRTEGKLLTACTIVSAKWPELDTGGDVVVRLSAGRFGDDRAAGLDDEALVGRLLAELHDAVPVKGAPDAVRVSRWMRSFPQYAPGHLDLVAAVEAELVRDASGVVVAGAAYKGVGIPACIASGTAAADSLAGPAKER